MSGRIIVSLSGVVGAGKSTTAKRLAALLRDAGVRVEQVRFQQFTELRAQPVREDPPSSARAAGGSGPPAAEGVRRQGYRRRALTWPVALGYVLRTLVFRWRVRRMPGASVLVFDRYFYDSLAHFELETAGLPLRLLVRSVPRPTVAALLLIPEGTILERRPFYSADYARQAAQAYERLPNHIEGLLTLTTQGSADAVAAAIAGAVLDAHGRRIDQTS